MNTFDVGVLDLAKQRNDEPARVILRRGDKNATTITATITDHGDPADTTGLSARFSMRLPDMAHYYSKAATLDGNAVSITINEEQAASTVGKTSIAFFELLDASGNLIASTSAFDVIVLMGAMDDTGIAESYSDELDVAMQQLAEAREDYEEMREGAQAAIDAANAAAESATMMATIQAAESATQAATSAAQTATQAASDANDAAGHASDVATSTAAAERERVTAETARANAESARANAESARAGAESARVNAESARATAESQRASAETSRQSAEQGRAAAESARVTEEESRTTAEQGRATAEQARSEAEIARATAETGRSTAESARDEAEQARVTAEQGRATAEQGRAAAESSRAEAEQSRATAESARVTAESARDTAETTRATAEQSRATAETARANAESVRVTAEQGRASAENARASAESARVTAESARASAETSRTTAESARATAETARRTAESARATEWAEIEPAAQAATQSATVAAALATRAAEAATAVVAAASNGNVPYGTLTGTVLTADDAWSAFAKSVEVYGKSTQDSTPTPDAPVPILSVDALTLHASADGTTDYTNWPVQIPLSNHIARSLPDGTHDELTLSYQGASTEHDGWGVYSKTLVQRVWHVDDVSTLMVSTFDADRKFIAFYAPKQGVNTTSSPTINVQSPYYQGARLLNKPCCYVTGNGTLIIFGNDDFADRATAESMLSGVSIDYQLVTPITHDLGTVELPVNPAPDLTAWADGGSAQPTMQLEYERALSIVIPRIEAAISDLATS